MGYKRGKAWIFLSCSLNQAAALLVAESLLWFSLSADRLATVSDLFN
jgi:hypothetical protein